MRKRKKHISKTETQKPYFITSEERDALWNRINHSLHRRRKRMLYLYSSMAAAGIIIIGSFLFLLQTPDKEVEWDIIEVAENAQSIFQKKNKETISRIDMASHKNEMLSVSGIQLLEESDSIYTFSPKNQNKRSSVKDYSSIHVPYGRRLEVELIDGTKVWLNAGSQLTFPKTFDDKEREVFLMGEGYFDVAHSQTPFKVLTSQNIIEVLGTSFNLSSYPEDETDIVELLSGKISFQSQKKLFEPITMNPSEELEMDLKSNHIKIRRGSSGNSILWTKKQMLLEKTPLPLLFKKLERVFNVQIYTENISELSSVLYSGRLDMNSSLESILSNIYELKDYRITMEGKEVSVKKK